MRGMEQGCNEFTKDCDLYLTESYKHNTYLRTYLYNGGLPDPMSGHVVIRVPGATRGHIVVNKDNVIQDVVFYPETCFIEQAPGSIACYNHGIIKFIKDKYVGTTYDQSKVTELFNSEGDK